MPVQYINRRGDRYFLLQGTTKTGKPKYYCSKRQAGTPVDRLPDGFEFHEDPQRGLVSVRKARPTRIAVFERELLERLASELADRHALIEVEGDSLVVYASDMSQAESARVLTTLAGKLTDDWGRKADWLLRHSEYSPMFRFTLTDEDRRRYSCERVSYRGGVDRWMTLQIDQPLCALARAYLPHLGHESFYELM